MTTTHGTQYSIGARVQVFHDRLTGGGRVLWYVGTIDGYWRNDCFHVREDEHETVCAIHTRNLAPVDLHAACVDGQPNLDCRTGLHTQYS